MSDEKASESIKRDRSPKFPYISLSKALERIEILYRQVRKNETRIYDIAKDWDLSPKSSSTDRSVAALQAFGLIEDSGSGESRKIRLSDFGYRILADDREGVKAELLSAAALKPQVISEYIEKWGNERPDDSHALSHLQFDGGFTPEGAKIFLRVYDDALKYLPSNESVKKNTDTDKNAVEDDKGIDNKREGASGDSTKWRDSPNDEFKQDVFSLDEGNVVLTWPKNLSSESYEDMSAWIQIMLKKIGRAVTKLDERP